MVYYISCCGDAVYLHPLFYCLRYAIPCEDLTETRLEGFVNVEVTGIARGAVEIRVRKLSVAEAHALATGVVEKQGTRTWFLRGKRHRDNDLPAEILSNGSQYWYKYGQRHRDGNLPAVVFCDGKCEWYVNGSKAPDPCSR